MSKEILANQFDLVGHMLQSFHMLSHVLSYVPQENYLMRHFFQISFEAILVRSFMEFHTPAARPFYD